ncbi:MAG: phage holin family protein [Anaerolineae bacterium]
MNSRFRMRVPGSPKSGRALAFRRFIFRAVISLVTGVPAILLASWVVPGFTITSRGAALFGLIWLSVFNAILRPLLVRLTLPINIVTAGLFTLLIDGFIIYLVHDWVEGWYVDSIWVGIAVSFILTIAQMFIANTIIGDDDRDVYFYQMVQRYARKDKKSRKEFDSPGMILLEIDGLSEPIMQRALTYGLMPHLKSLLDSGEYKLVCWDSGLPSQTSAMQAGILHGTHFNIPAFRFYNKQEGRLYVSNRPGDASEMLGSLNNGQGLLDVEGFSLNNWATGNAQEVMLTFASGEAGLKMLGPSNNLYQFFANFNNVQQVIAGSVADLWREWRQARYQRRKDIQPRVHRGYPYPLVRVATTVLFPFLSVYLLLGKMFEGVGTVYTTFVSYDEVAHHSGIDRPDAMQILTKLDAQIRQVMNARPYVHRKYEVILLSDHGQTMGATFKQRYGFTLGEFVNKLLGSESAIQEQLGGDEAIASINLLASQLTNSDRWVAKRMRAATRRRTDEDGVVQLFDQPDESVTHGAENGDPRATTVVVASGNLGLIYFAYWKERLSGEQIAAEFPGFVMALVSHPGIGFVVLRSEEDGLIAVGQRGVYYLDNDTFEGENPLEVFGPNAPLHLRDLDTYPCMPDILVNSFYDPVNDEGAAFEELVGFHGGLGGEQTMPFLMYPSHLEEGELPPIIGAPDVYRVIRRWQEQLRQTSGSNVAKAVRPELNNL